MRILAIITASFVPVLLAFAQTSPTAVPPASSPAVQTTNPAPQRTTSTRTQVQQYLQRIRRNNQDKEAWDALIDLYEQNPRRQLAYLERAIQVVGPYGSYYVKMADAFVALGMNQEAASNYALALEKLPTAGRVYYRYGLVLQDMGRLHEAEIAFRASLYYDKSSTAVVRAGIYRALGEVLEQQMRMEEALAAYHVSLGLNAAQPDLQVTIQRLSES